ncbi:DEAD/DEAH box helicase [Streptomyces sp. H27-D2]|uniref:DEAD/DEAH box helicase n=1 Tax=Streptomyces sp. H27-D2 TaxID=3046304 RepID=UPI002DB652BD|nr:DEAD/DEAH box helicase [Streptomyces sp. H27-D2]MEC4018136.1 DEAD/DEAH box helicase [Streptomyces sp. H27-D2]
MTRAARTPRTPTSGSAGSGYANNRPFGSRAGSSSGSGSSGGGRPSGGRSGGGNGGGGNGGGGGGRPRTQSSSAPRRQATAAPAAEFAMPVSSTPALPPVEAFADLNMPAGLLATLTREGLTEPFPIQAATLPNAIFGRDVLGRGRTGSGKTLAFGLALLARTAGKRAESKRPLALVLVPTRELAQQVTDALTPYATAVNLRMTTVVGGMSISRQANQLQRGSEVVVATPGRLADLINRGDAKLDHVSITVLDEADQMADMGFLPQVTKLLDQVVQGGQCMLFSATLDRNVDRLVKRFLNDPVTHSVDPSANAVSTMEHHVLHVTDADKRDATTHIAAREGRVIMFVDTKRGADRLAKHLLASGVRASALHGGKSQPQRNRTLDQFKSGHVTALIATNVAARGIHIDNLDLVVNVDPPTDHKDYLHRGGRTARAGESGSVVTLVMPNQRREMARMMTIAGISPNTAQVRSGDEELTRITGARTPSGVPIIIAAPAEPVRPRGAGPGAGTGRARRSRPRGAAGTGAPSAGRTGGASSGRGGNSSGRGGNPSGRSANGGSGGRRASAA